MKTDVFDAEELTLITLAQEYSDNDKARTLLESLRWPNGEICPHCKNDGKTKGIYALRPAPKSKTRKGVHKCGACRKQFTVTVGTVFESSHIPISTWLMAVFILCSSKKSISAHQMHRMLKVTYKTAWFMCHRIRYAMGTTDEKNLPQLLGTVEIDETYVGGKGDPKTKVFRKTPVVALIERDGIMRSKVVSNVTQKNLGAIIREHVHKDSILNTDDSGVYRLKYRDYRRHDIVNHSRFEYIRRNPDGSSSGVNHCESFFSLLKRGVVGAWHHVSREHLHRYASEFEFRWNHRRIDDGPRMVKAIQRIEGKRLTYRQTI
ncbi:MAG TPA: IS1595 family transposase [Verrucomicrobiae bacterium]|nr:IS1595 family transposase [Verrucomicrobiae bacterium]